MGKLYSKFPKVLQYHLFKGLGEGFVEMQHWDGESPKLRSTATIIDSFQPCLLYLLADITPPTTWPTRKAQRLASLMAAMKMQWRMFLIGSSTTKNRLFPKQIGVTHKIKVVDVCIKRWMFVLRAIDLNHLIQIIWICMLHKRSGESARSRMPVFSRRILESAKPCRAIFYLS